MTYTEYHRKYQREWKRRALTIDFKPADKARLKSYYEEYTTTCQQNQYPTVDFHQFIIQYCEMGFFAWRDRNKNK